MAYSALSLVFILPPCGTISFTPLTQICVMEVMETSVSLFPVCKLYTFC